MAALVRMPPTLVSSRLRTATDDSACGTAGCSVFGATTVPSGPVGAAGSTSGPPGSAHRPVSSRYRIAPRPFTSSRAVASGREPGKASRSLPSEVTRMRCGWSTPSTRPAWCAPSTAAASGSSSLDAVPGGSGPSETRSTRSVPWVHSATTMPSRPSAGLMPLRGLSTSSTRETPGWVKLAACMARSRVRLARLAAATSSGCPTNSVTATSRLSWPSLARHNWAPLRWSTPDWASSR